MIPPKSMLQVPDLTLGELERQVLEILWRQGPLKPGDVHEALGEDCGISVNTVSSALKRLVDKRLLERQKVSHAFVYEARVSRSDLQRSLLSAIAGQFGPGDGSGFLAAFVDLAVEQGDGTLERLEAMIAARREDES